MAKRKERKMKWKNFVFTPRGADRATHGIKYGDDGFLHICLRWNNGDYLREYDVTDTTFRPGDGGRNVSIDWTGFKEAMQKWEAKHPPKPSVFSGPYQHCEEGNALRQRMLHAICREYQHPESLADDLWAWVRQGKPEETENLLKLLILYWRQENAPPACKPVADASS